MQPKTISTREIYYMLRSDKPCMRSDGEGSEAGPVHARNSKSDLNSATQSTQKSGASLLRQARGYRSFAEPARWILDVYYLGTYRAGRWGSRVGCSREGDTVSRGHTVASWVLSRGRYSQYGELGALARAIQSIRGVSSGCYTSRGDWEVCLWSSGCTSRGDWEVR